MNNFMSSALGLIKRNGVSSSYKVITEGAYDIETSSVVTTEVTHTVILYRKHIRANQYNFPDLVGKETAIFYLSNADISFSPKPNDIIVSGGDTFTVQSVIEYNARGQLVFYKLVSVKG